MADDKVAIQIGADLSNFRDQLRSAQQSVSQLATTFSALREASKNAFPGDIAANLQTVRTEAARAGQTLSDISGQTSKAADGMRRAGEAAKGAGAGVGFYAREIHAVIDEVLSGRSQQLSGTLANIALTSGQAALGFARANLALTGFGAAGLATAGVLSYLTYKAEEAREAIQRVIVQAAAAGNSNNSPQGVAVLLGALSRLPGSTAEASEAFAASLAKINDSSNIIGAGVTNSLQTIADMTGKTIPDAMDRMSKALAAPASQGRQMIDELGGMTAAESDAMDAAQRSGDAHQQLAVFLGALARATKDAAVAAKDATTTHINFFEKVLDATNIFRWFGAGLGIAGAATKRFGDEANRAGADLAVAAEKAKALQSSIKETIAAANGIANRENPLSKQLQDSIEKANQLRDALNKVREAEAKVGAASTLGGTGDPAELIKRFEGFSAQAQWDRNAYRVGYGSDTTTDRNGVVRPVTQWSGTTEEDAQRDLNRRVAEFAAKAAQDVGAAWASLSDRVRASLTSIAYNYGRVPSNIVAAAQTGNESNIASAIAARAGDNGGINSHRRIAEAANIGGGNSPASTMLDALQQEEGTQARIREEIKAAEDARKGGNAVQLEELAAAERAAAGQRHEVEEAQKKVEADKQELSSLTAIGASQASISAAKLKLYNDEAALQDRLYAVEQARNKLASTQANKDLQGQLDIAQKALPGVTGRFGAGSQEEIAAQTQIAQIQTQIKAQEQADAAATARVKYENDLEATDKQKANIQELAKANVLSYAAQIAAAKEAAARKTSIEQEYVNEIKRIYGEGVPEYRRAMQQQSVVARQINQQLVNDTKKANEEIEASFKKVAESIATTMSSALMRVIERTGNFRDMFRSVVQDIAQMFLQAVTKMIADWAALQAATAFIGTGGGAAGGLIGGLLHGIGIPGFATGAWELPRDTLAQVHAGEMIIPAAHADTLRSALSGSPGGSYGSSGGGDRHLHVHYSAERGTTLDTLRQHSRALAKMVSDEMDRNPSLRPAY